MTILERIKYFLFPPKQYLVEDFEFENPTIEFNQFNDETALNIAKYFKENVSEASKIGAKYLKPKEASEFSSIDDLIVFIKQTIEYDFKEMTDEGYKFYYFMNHDYLDTETTCIYNKFTYYDVEMGNMIFAIISIRKFNGKYYGWTKIDGYEPAGNSG